ncbi:MAG: DegQ family serine endoprotease [Thermodesulfovibrionales bacterium]
MKRKIFAGFIILLVGFLLGGLTYFFINRHLSSTYPGKLISGPRVPSQIIETSRAFSDIVAEVSPAVVNISSTKVFKRDAYPFSEDPFFDLFRPFHDFDQKKWKEQSLGSGVIISEDGYIITNNHVVEKSEDIRVILYDKRSFKGKVIGSDPKTDIAIVKISAQKLPSVRWGNSDHLKVGEFVLAIGNPYGLSHTVTMGIISAVGRANVGIADYEDFIQTDAAINPGNSGGPLVNINGELIGINTAIFSRSGGYQGIGFAVPSNMARLVMEQLIKQGKIVRGWLGVMIQEVTPEIAQKFGLKEPKGALVSDITKGSPAEKAGIIRGDIIIEYDGKAISSVSNLRNSVAQTKVGSQVRIKIIRNGKEFTLNVIVAELPKEMATITEEPEGDIQRNAFSGVTVYDLTKEIALQLGLNSGEKGVVVVKVESGSPAEEAGLKKGDVIQEIDRKKINNMEDFRRVTSLVGSKEETILLYINRGGKRLYITLNRT